MGSQPQPQPSPASPDDPRLDGAVARACGEYAIQARDEVRRLAVLPADAWPDCCTGDECPACTKALGKAARRALELLADRTAK